MEPPKGPPANIFSENLYERLGVSPYATPGEIEKQWRQRLRGLHPDAGGANETTALLNEAKMVLSDPTLRAAYDKDGMGAVSQIIQQGRRTADPAKTPAAPVISVPSPKPAPTMQKMPVASAPAPLAQIGFPQEPPAIAPSVSHRPQTKRPLNVLIAAGAVALLAGASGGGVAWWLLHNSNPAPKVAGRAPTPDSNSNSGTSDISAAAPARRAAAPNETTIRITRAAWGTAAKSVNAIAAVNRLIHDGRLAFEVTPEVLQADPAPGAPKRLILNYVLNGKTHSETHAQGSTVIIPAGSAGDIVKGPDTPQPSAPAAASPGRPAPAAPSRAAATPARDWSEQITVARSIHPTGLVVLEAKWGPAGGMKDVTDICQQAVSGNSMTIPLTEEAFQQPKAWQPSFNITYLDGDQVKTDTGHGAVFQVGPHVTTFLKPKKGLQNIDALIASLRAWRPTGVVVLDAEWGNSDGRRDVTELCQTAATLDSLTIPVSPAAFGDKAAGGADLKIIYNDGKETKDVSIPDGKTLQVGALVTTFVRADKGLQNLAATISQMRKTHPTGLLVLDARYGSGETSKDVTAVCQSLVSGDSITIPTSPAAFRVDAIWQAGFTITYTDGHDVKTVTAPEYSTLQIGPQVTGFLRAGTGAMTVADAFAEQRAKYGDGLLILNASYGEGHDFQDVRDLLQARVASGRLATKIGGAGWPDPAPNRGKQINITYWDGAAAKLATVKEGDLVDISAALPDALKSLVALPPFVAAGKQVVHNFAAGGNYSLASAPVGVTLSPTGQLSWTPAESQVGTQEIKFNLHVNGKNYIQSYKTEVVSAATAAAVGGDLKRLQSFMRLDLAAVDHTYQASFDRQDALVLDKERLTVIGADGITVKSSLKLPKTYVRIAERDGYYVAIRLEPLAMDLLDKQTGRPTKTIKLDYRGFHDLALLPNKAVSFVSADIADSVPRDRIVVVDEASGEVREPKDLMGTYMQIDRSGEHLWVGLKDIYRNGTDYHINPDFNIIDIPTYGNIDYLIRYDLVDGGLVLKEHLDSVGINGSGLEISPDGKRVAYLSFTGFPQYSKNLAYWKGSDFESKPVIYNIKDATGGKGAEHIQFHPVLPLVLIPKEDGVMIFGRDSGDEELNRIKVAAGALAGIAVRNARFSPDGLSVILDCTSGEKAFLYKIPLILTDDEKRQIKQSAGAAPHASPAPGPRPVGDQQG